MKLLFNRRPCRTSTSDGKAASGRRFDFSDIVSTPNSALSRRAEFEVLLGGLEKALDQALRPRKHSALRNARRIGFQDYFYDSQKLELTIRE
jgi:hypothetical protein